MPEEKADAQGTRSFIAVDIPENIKDDIISVSENIKLEGIKPVNRDQIHITLFFLGYMNAGHLDLVKALLAGLKNKKFRISIRGVGTFSASKPRVVFANIGDGSLELRDLYSGMLNGIRDIGVGIDERGFTPHLTIARVREMRKKQILFVKDFINKYLDHDFGSFECDSVRLKQSVLRREGALHTDLYVKELATY